jgi:hypothetical protein
MVTADVPHFFSYPAPFYIKPGETKVIIFKYCIDRSVQTEEAYDTYYNVIILFKLTANCKAVYSFELHIKAGVKPDWNVYLTSFLLPENT